MEPAAETDPVPHGGDAADDPAIWVNRRDPSESSVIATDNRGGIAVYDLSGRELQYRPDGEVNNVDLRQGFPLGGRRTALVAASEKRANTIVLYRVDPATRRLVRLSGPRIEPGLLVHGLCTYRGGSGGPFYVFVDSEKGEVEQWEITEVGGGRVGGRRVGRFDLGGPAEACVADDAGGEVYFSAERDGIWRFAAEPGAARGGERVVAADGKRLVPDVEGLAIATTEGGARYLLASSQGSSTFAAYELPRYSYVGGFKIGPGGNVDSASDTDGIEVTTTDLGGDFRSGLLVAQDGSNDGENQNFKLVPWDAVEAAIRQGP